MRGRCVGPTHLPLVEELLQLPIRCVEALVRGSWPLFVQDIGRWQIVLQPQQEFLCLVRSGGIDSATMRGQTPTAHSHPDPAT